MGGRIGIFRAFSPRARASVVAGGISILAAGLAQLAPANAVAAPPRCPIPAETTTIPGTPNAGFLSSFALLRRPKVASDELPVTPGLPVYPLLGEGVYVNYIRRAQVVGGTSYYVIPVQKALRLVTCVEPEELFLVSVTPDGNRAAGGATLQQIRHGSNFATSWTSAGATISGLVPDGVAEVTAIYKINRRHHVSVTMNVINNVFVTTVPRQLFPQPLPEMPTLVIWHSASGKRIRTIDIQH